MAPRIWRIPGPWRRDNGPNALISFDPPSFAADHHQGAARFCAIVTARTPHWQEADLIFVTR
jgi:hypothetical protein